MNKKQLIASLDRFTRGYLEAALFTSCSEKDRALDRDYGIEHLTVEALKRAEKDCQDFRNKCRLGAGDALPILFYDHAGRDFWLTRNRHGAGFWDGGWEKELGERLTAVSREFKEVDLYLWRGKIHST